MCATLSIIDDASSSSSSTVLLSASISPSISSGRPSLPPPLALFAQGEGWARVHEFADHVTVPRKLDWPRRYVPFLGIQAELLVIDLHGLAIGREFPHATNVSNLTGRTGVFIRGDDAPPNYRVLRLRD